MRLVLKHAVVGYQPPQSRDACRNCKFLDCADDDRPGYPVRPICKLHGGIEVNGGGICPHHSRGYSGVGLKARVQVMPRLKDKPPIWGTYK